MTKLLDEAIAEIRKLPDAEQDRAAALLLALAQERESEQDEAAADYRLTPEQVAQVRDTIRRIEDGTMTFVSEEEMAAVWARFGV